MSVKVMGAVWDMDLPSDEKFVLLAYADHAEHDGGSIFPSIGLIARKTCYSPRSIQRITRALENRGRLIRDGSGPHGTRRWRIPIDVAGDKMSPLEAKPAGGVTQLCQGGGDKLAGGGDIAMSPEPSFEPSSNRQREGSFFRCSKCQSLVLWQHKDTEIGNDCRLHRQAIGDYKLETYKLTLPPGGRR